jgi:hypothetical protein
MLIPFSEAASRQGSRTMEPTLSKLLFTAGTGKAEPRMSLSELETYV